MDLGSLSGLIPALPSEELRTFEQITSPYCLNFPIYKMGITVVPTSWDCEDQAC